MDLIGVPFHIRSQIANTEKSRLTNRNLQTDLWSLRTYRVFFGWKNPPQVAATFISSTGSQMAIPVVPWLM